MNIHTNVHIRYFKDFKRVEPTDLNSGRLADYKSCPELYRFKNVLGYRPKGDPIYLVWGGAVHKFREALEVLWAQHKYANEAIVGLAVIEAMKFWGNTKDPPADDRKFGFMTKARLADLLIFIGKLWLQEKQLGNMEILSAEKSFSLQLPNGQWISGTPDQMVRWSGRVYGRDFKTTTKQIKWYKRDLFPNDQFARYTWSETQLHGAQVVGQIIDIIHMTKDEGPTFHREIVSFSQETLDRWLEDQEHWTAAIQRSRETDIYPQNENHCKWCPFHNVCRSSSQLGKEYVLKTEYKFEPWDNIREGAILLGG